MAFYSSTAHFFFFLFLYFFGDWKFVDEHLCKTHSSLTFPMSVTLSIVPQESVLEGINTGYYYC